MTGLAYIGRIEEVRPIENADRIEAAEIVCGEGGRWCGVVEKGKFRAGQKCLAYLQDAVVQPCDDLAFLEKTKWRVRMQRFRGVPSECVIVGLPSRNWDIAGEIGEDLTGLLGVTKYEKPIPACLGGKAAGTFPSFIPKTDEPNFQTAGRLVEALRGKPWYATVKADGSSTTAYRLGDHFGVCSRNLELTHDRNNAYWKVAEKHGLRHRLPDGIALQWETVGPGIQKNPMGLKEVGGLAFSAYDFRPGEHRYLGYLELVSLCTELLDFPMVPIDSSGESFDMDSESLRRMAEGAYLNGRQREGIVIRPQSEERVGNARLSFKVINLLYKD